MAKDKINETANAVSSRSRGGKLDKDKIKQQQGTVQEQLFTEKIKRLLNMLEDNNASSTIARPNKLN